MRNPRSASSTPQLFAAGWLLLFMAVIPMQAAAQLNDAQIEALIGAVSLDSLTHSVEVLSGETSWDSGVHTVTIESRNRNSIGNDFAAEYIAQRLAGYGLDVRRDDFSATGTNILAVQRSAVQPSYEVIVWAHYDGVPAHAADDNASGTAAVLEAARLLSGVELPYTVVYALWDEEEAGLLGSKSFARRARDSSLTILGVLNLEMFGWDANSDMQCEIHVRDVGMSADIAAAMQQINTQYQIGLVPMVLDPGITASDHSPFWDYNYPAVMLIQAWMTGDRDPAYHTPQDRLSAFNLPYFLRLAKLSVASLAHFASGRTPLDSSEGPVSPSTPELSTVWPQPLSGRGTLKLRLPSAMNVKAEMFDVIGRRVKSVPEIFLDAGVHWLRIDAGDLSEGLYLYRIDAGGAVLTRRIVVLR